MTLLSDKKTITMNISGFYLKKKSASTILSSALALLRINFISPVFPVYAVRSFLKNFHLPEIASDLGVGLYDYQKKYLLNIILWE